MVIFYNHKLLAQDALVGKGVIVQLANKGRSWM